MRNTKTYLPQKTLVAIIIGSLVLTGCGGGGGGGGSSGGQTVTAIAAGNPVPFYTPQRVGTTQVLQNGTTTVAGSNESTSTITAKDLTGTGAENVIVTGRAYGPSNPVGSNSTWDNSVISVYGWQNGQLVDQTAQWFAPGDNVIVGTENAPKFGRFGAGGRTGMYVAPYTDNNVFGDGAVFINNGNSFTRVNIALGIPISDSVVYDINRDGIDDIYHQTNTAGVKMSFGNANGTFNTMTNRSAVGAGTSAAIADFMGNGTSSIIVTDSSNGQTARTRLYSWSIANGDLNLAQISVLPESRFNLPKWAGYNFGGGAGNAGHDVKALAFDFDNSGLTSALIISRPNPIPNQAGWPAFSEVQFLKNQGGGVFTDVTDTTLFNYNTSTNASYSPVLTDVNNDGLTDVVLSSMTYDGKDTTQVLIHTREHKYMASYANVITAFQNQAADLQRAVSSTLSGNANTVAFVRGPDNSLYLVSGVDYHDNGVVKKAIYLSKLGTAGTVTAQATINAIRQAWPWMSAAQANQVLSQSSQTWFGLNVIDPQAALNPIGPLAVNVRGAMQQITGALGGVNLNGAARTFITFDTFGRSFSVDYSGSNFNMSHFWSQNISDPVIDDTRSAVGTRFTNMEMNQVRLKSPVAGMGFIQSELGQGMFDEAVIKMGTNQAYNGSVNPYTGTIQQPAYSYAITNVKPFSDRNFAMNMQYSNLPFSPFVQMSGVWGQVNSADMLEMSASYKYQGLVGKVGAINSYTNMNPGLVNNVTPITSVWGEVGHEWKVVKAYVGMLPKIVAGEMNISLPTGVDNLGNTKYTNMNAGVNNPMVGYARVQMFNFTDRARTKSYSVNGMVSTDNNKAVMANFTHRF